MVWSMVHVQLKDYKTKLIAKSTKSRTKMPNLAKIKHEMQKKGQKRYIVFQRALGWTHFMMGFCFVEGTFIPTFIVVATQITFLQIMCNSCCCFNIWYSLFEKFVQFTNVQQLEEKKVWGEFGSIMKITLKITLMNDKLLYPRVNFFVK